MNKLIALFWNIICAFSIAVCIIAPDFMSKSFDINNLVIFNKEFFKIVCFFCFLLSFCNNKFIYSILLIFAILEITQFTHLSHFGTFIPPFTIKSIFTESSEILVTGFTEIRSIMIAILIVLIPYLCAFFVTKFLEKKKITYSYSYIFVLIMLMIIPYKVVSANNFIIFYPNPTTHSLRNSLYAYGAFLFKILPSMYFESKEKISYLPYEIYKKEINLSKNIIVIMGESYTYSNMSLFGYKRNTSPKMSSLKKDKNFIYKKGISGGVSTKVSLPVFFNAIREPENYVELYRNESNLFKLAKENGYKTHFISSQEGNLVREIGVKYIDNLIVKESQEDLFKKHKDEALIILMKKINFNEKNFIVLHQRNIHEPYHLYYDSNFAKYTLEKNSIVNAYDNGALYNDFLHFSIISYIKRISKLPYEIFFTSDHGEMLGEEGEYGHGNLKYSAAKIPFLYYSNLKPIHKFSDYITHYEISSHIIKSLGYKLINPNYKKNIYYIHGNNFGGKNDFLEIDKSNIVPNISKIKHLWLKSSQIN